MAGCLTAQATALEHRDSARSRADAWDPAAELAGILGVEGRIDDVPGFWHTSASAADIPWDRARDDPTRADGRCEFWVYAYVAEGRDEAILVVVDQDGQVLDTGTTDRTAEMGPVGEVSVDSDRAVEIAKSNNGAIRSASGVENATMLQTLGRESDQDHARWLVAGGPGSARTAEAGIVVIDAVTGDVLHSETRDGSA